jgi:hypothetical protein
MISHITVKTSNIEGTGNTFYDMIDNLDNKIFEEVWGASFSGLGIRYDIERGIASVTVSAERLSVSGGGGGGEDMIRSQLSTSLASYDSASTNQWVKVTKSEYDLVFANIPGATKRGNTDLQVATRAVAAGFTEMTFSVNNDPTQPLTVVAGEYPIAFVAETWNGNANVQFGYTTAFHTGSPIYGNSVAVTPVGACYYVRKSPSGMESAPATQTLYPAIKISGNSFNLVPNTSGWYTTNGGTSWTQFQGNAGNGAAKFQMIVTQTRSW